MIEALKPKSDQMNADDLIGGPRTIRITEMVIRAGDQPISVFFDGCDGKPYKPGKSMGRVMMHVWGPDATQYIGKSMTLYNDLKVTFGPTQPGGIRISHISDIAEKTTVWITDKKGSRKPWTVLPLVVEADKVETEMANPLIERIRGTADMAALEVITADAKVITQRAWLAGKRPHLAERVTAAVTAKLESFAAISSQEEQP
jgi:hypothetical protein